MHCGVPVWQLLEGEIRGHTLHAGSGDIAAAHLWVADEL